MEREATAGSMLKVAVTGSSGLVGTALVRFLRGRGDRVVRLVRQTPHDHYAEARWEPQTGVVEARALEGLDVLVHLAGESIANGRLTGDHQRRVRESRVRGTQGLARTLAAMDAPPKTFVCASAVGYYGDRGDEELTEESPPGKGVLVEICREWEAACEPAREKGIRVVNLRTGLVLSAEGGALKRMLTPFRLGLGGRLGTGSQYMTWIVLEDLVHVIAFVMEREDLAGPVNAVAPQAVTNREFTEALARVLNRPALLPAPAFALRLVLGEMADALLLASARVLPRRLEAGGFRFEHPELSEALRHVLGRKEEGAVH